MTPAEQLDLLTVMVERIPYRPDTRTPAEVERDNWLEGVAERRADERMLPVGGREADRLADVYFGACR